MSNQQFDDYSSFLKRNFITMTLLFRTFLMKKISINLLITQKFKNKWFWKIFSKLRNFSISYLRTVLKMKKKIQLLFNKLLSWN